MTSKHLNSALDQTQNQTTLLGELTHNQFFDEYWQKKPLLLSQVGNDFNDVVDANDLAAFACEPEVESRLISGKDAHWNVEHGPFSEKRFEELPEKDWTLLVQAVDHWIPEVRNILSRFSFLPSWRLDDVMVSYATNGGSVGPHFDYYDVFLLQTSGKRQWRIGQKCDETTEILANQPIKLLQKFEQNQEYVLSAGDMIYVPAGVAHWGTALDDDCITWSIGFRAPSHKELLAEALQQLVNELPEQLRYVDSGESLSEQHGELGPGVQSQISSVLTHFTQSKNFEEKMESAMTDALGRLTTELRYPEFYDIEFSYTDEQEGKPITNTEHDAINYRSEFVRLLKQGQCGLNPKARVAYREVETSDKRPVSEKDKKAVLFANGEQINVPLVVAKMVCSNSVEPNVARVKPHVDILFALFEKGIIQ